LTPLENIQKEIAAQPNDIRAEVLVAQLLKSALTWPQLVVHADHFFTRRFSRDITDTEIVDAQAEALHIHLSRTGLYDLLPEGLFFAPVSADKSPKNAGEMAEEYKANQAVEAGIRRFFAPFENEFFYHRVQNFETEVTLLNGLQDELLNRYFIGFWNMPETIPPAMAIKMILLLPYIHQVTGDADLMAESLQTILNEKVSCRLLVQANQDTGLHYNILGGYELGNTLTCGKMYFEEDHCFEFTLHLRETASPTHFLPGGKLYPVLDTFRRFFVPAQTDMITMVKLPLEQEQMRVGHETGSILGMATVI
jgi:hypothetical protein